MEEHSQAIKLTPEPGYFSIDVETTGGNLFQDECFAIGWAFGSSIKTPFETGNACLSLKKHSGSLTTFSSGNTNATIEEWFDFWDSQGYEKRCWEEFWSKNVNTLNFLQNPENVNIFETKRDMVLALNEALKKAESMFSSVTIVTDTTAFDTVWVEHLLSLEDLPGIIFKRNGKYNGKFIHTGSYTRGVYRSSLGKRTKPWDEDEEFTSLIPPTHDHNPENDARYILNTFFSAKKASKRLKSNTP